MLLSNIVFQHKAGCQKGWTPKPASQGMITRDNVHIDQALRTPQFWLLWVVLCFNVTAGIGVIGVAKTMINEIFGSLVIVTKAFAGTYVLMISVFNMVGRFFWASTSDYIGRKNTYHCFFILGTILYLSIPYFAGDRQYASACWVLSCDDGYLHPCMGAALQPSLLILQICLARCMWAVSMDGC